MNRWISTGAVSAALWWPVSQVSVFRWRCAWRAVAHKRSVCAWRSITSRRSGESVGGLYAGFCPEKRLGLSRRTVSLERAVTLDWTPAIAQGLVTRRAVPAGRSCAIGRWRAQLISNNDSLVNQYSHSIQLFMVHLGISLPFLLRALRSIHSAFAL